MLKPQELGDSRSGQTDLSPLIPPAEPELSEPCTSVDPLLWTAFLPGSVAWAERIKWPLLAWVPESTGCKTGVPASKTPRASGARTLKWRIHLENCSWRTSRCQVQNHPKTRGHPVNASPKLPFGKLLAPAGYSRPTAWWTSPLPEKPTTYPHSTLTNTKPFKLQTFSHLTNSVTHLINCAIGSLC